MQIHQFKNNGYNLVLDVPSGSVHVVDDIVYDVLPIIREKTEEKIRATKSDRPVILRYKAVVPKEDIFTALSGKYSKEELSEAVEEIETLIEEGVLFSDNDYRPAIEEFQDRKTVVKALCLHIAHDCNLRCKYCFADEGEYHGRRALMDVSCGKAALDFLIAQSEGRRNLEVDFFGGEPLLSLPVVKELVAYGRSLEKEHNKRFRFTLTTNGVLLDDDFAEFANRELDNVVLSLDGRKEVHDRMRPFPGGQGSYDTVLPKFREFVSRRREKKYYLRGTFTRYNKDFAEDVLHMADMGFTELSMEPVVAPDDADYAIRKEDLPEICAEYDRLAKEMLEREKKGKGFHFFHFMIDLSGGPCVYKRLSGCGSGTEYLAVTPWGDLYPCHQFVGQEEFLIGNVYDGIVRQDIVRSFKAVNVYAKEECQSCFARFYCSGGCAANAWNFTHDLRGNYEIGCVLERKRVECALMMKAAEADMEQRAVSGQKE